MITKETNPLKHKFTYTYKKHTPFTAYHFVDLGYYARL